MASELWTATIDRVGEFTTELFDGGCYILFGDPVPDALAEVSIVHNTRQAPSREIVVGDVVVMDDIELRLDEVGERANLNLTDLGHAVIYVNSPDQPLLPGAIKASGSGFPHPVAGSAITFRGQ